MNRVRRQMQRLAVRLRDNRIVRTLTPSRLRFWLAGKLFPPTPPPLEGAGWMQAHAAVRAKHARPVADTGLLSFITPVWNTPVAFLRELADSVLDQAEQQPLEWVVLDNGSTDPELIDYLDGELRHRDHVAFHRSPENLGIVKGTRACLERASRRYVLPLDHDDRLYPDAAAVMARTIVEHGYPALLYSDEDKLVDGEPQLPFFKPDWDPVLFVNQCYTAHLCAADRQLALCLDAYGDRRCEGSPDWDCFMRFAVAGHIPVHVPEVIYSWRMHAQSTALNIDAKSYIHSSHGPVLERFVGSLSHSDRFSIEPSPLFDGTPDWWIRRRHVDPRPLVVVSLVRAGSAAQTAEVDCGDYRPTARASLPAASTPTRLLDLLPPSLPDDALVALLSSDVQILEPDWPWEALGVFEAFDDAVLVGGRCLDDERRVVEAGQYFGVGLGSDSPDVGRRAEDPGYSVWLWKQHSVSAVSSCFAVFRADFLRELLHSACPPTASLQFLGAWAGAHAMRSGRRIVYTPFLCGHLSRQWSGDVTAAERRAFLEGNRDIVPDTRFYSANFGLEIATSYQPVPQSEREAHLQRVFYFADRRSTFRRSATRLRS